MISPETARIITGSLSPALLAAAIGEVTEERVNAGTYHDEIQEFALEVFERVKSLMMDLGMELGLNL